MTKIVIFLILFSLLGEIFLGSVTSKHQSKYTPSHYKLRKFGFFDVNQNNEIAIAYKILMSIQKNMEKQKLDSENRETLRKEAKRRKIYEQHLLAYQGGSSFLKDFHTNRF